MREFSFEESRRGQTAELVLAGDLDMSATFRLEPAIDRLLEEAEEIVLDLSEVQFVDSSGLGLLLATHQRTQEAECSMAIVNSRPEIQRVFRLAGVDDVLPLSPSP